ncbi:alpha-L-arabinofuranosidase C-terminal domain-containing protein [uncultured Muribaculum sp.]|uniref:alpha-L-arabinofuranosidase C-terminal domain-containing protein n=1 Tax=uncultured Muribaculum sp. TaxID=1918613 RepID=UPI0025F01D77|nr:alpha-L-arabinofuranosidase C-terminal domain-containing protein [uncultured Muribaculum sp.]
MAAISATADVPAFDVRCDKVGAEIAPTMYGIFFEDINYGADGGLYAEMVKNRSFEFPQTLMGWNTIGDISVRDDGPFPRNPHYLRMSPTGHREKRTVIENEGFFGVSFEKDKEYRFSLWARKAGDGKGEMRIELCDPSSASDNTAMVSAQLDIDSPDWKKYTVILKPSATVEDGTLRIYLVDPVKSADIDVEHVSLFPVDTWRGHENGLRADMAGALYDLHPGVFRFPGGCIVEGTRPADRYQWKNTVGPVENRPTIANRWADTFPSRLAPDYYQSGGLGFYEYFQLAEEIGAEPLPVLNVGMLCQYQNTPDAHVPVDSLDCYVRDALDLVEFANGDTLSTWGALRASMGHPASFNLKYVAIGNEQWGSEYVERLEPFVKAMRKAHPEINIIGSSGPGVDDPKFDYLWPEMTRLGVDLVDEHYYRNEDWFLANAARYDAYDRKRPKVFAGEYACHPKGQKRNNYTGALSEAAFMTGLERNADVVNMCTYAPLFANVNGWQWRPDLIWVDNFKVIPTDSYEIQRLYSLNKGTNVVPLTMDGRPVAGGDGQQGLYASAVYDKDAGTYIVKVANTSLEPRDFKINMMRLPKKASWSGVTRTLFTRAAESINAAAGSTDDLHTSVISTESLPTDFSRKGSTDTFSSTLPARSFAIYRYSISR